MIVVADPTPINYLILIEKIVILQKMYGTDTLPPLVHDELLRLAGPATVRKRPGQSAKRLEVRAPANAPDAMVAKSDPGERDAILPAGELRADQLIVDDREGRREAEKHGLAVMGTLGVLKEAATLGLLDLRLAVKRLQGTNFYLAPEILARLLKDQP